MLTKINIPWVCTIVSRRISHKKNAWEWRKLNCQHNYYAKPPCGAHKIMLVAKEREREREEERRKWEKMVINHCWILNRMIMREDIASRTTVNCLPHHCHILRVINFTEWRHQLLYIEFYSRVWRFNEKFAVCKINRFFGLTS